MKLRHITRKLPLYELVTVVDCYGGILVDRCVVGFLAENEKFEEYKNETVICLSIGKVHGDLIITI